MAQAELCVIFNPAAGKGQAARRLAKLRHLWGRHVDFQPTDAAGHAIELARQAALNGFRIVAAAGGDGTVHEVANGLLLAGRPDVRFGIIPIGSANDYHASLELEPHPADQGPRTVDVGMVREPGGREKFFVCCLGLGFNGCVTLESRKIKRLQGIALYGLATLRALWYHYRCPNMELAIDDRPALTVPTLMLSVLVGRREGGFVFAPRASVSDGWLDYVHAGSLSRWEVLKFLPRLALAGPPESYPKIEQGRCRRIRLASESSLIVHVDGEFFCRPEDDIRRLEIEIRPGALRVESMNGLAIE
jgi:diacylglycerol kinase (ATP)